MLIWVQWESEGGTRALDGGQDGPEKPRCDSVNEAGRMKPLKSWRMGCLPALQRSKQDGGGWTRAAGEKRKESSEVEVRLLL